MADDSTNSFASSPEDRLKALISCPSASAKSGDENELPEGGFEENHLLIDDNPSSICVICFSDDGKAERGKLDSCDHYFCFVCIMEWARIESRCPACKGRFTVVHRIAKDPCRLRERIVNIPMRNQDQSASGNARIRDPYAETCCTVCKGMEDEGLMLLCDLCDSAAHTFCVGLGANVPEGDWFCHDCTISRAQHTDTKLDTSFNNQNQTTTVEPRIAISDIVKESSSQTVGITRRGALLHSNRESPSIVPSSRSSVAQKSLPSRGGKAAGTGARTSARTLHRCRNIHSYIRALRDNWDAVRRGSLKFPASSSSTYCGNSSKRDTGGAELINKQTDQPQAISLQATALPECNGNSYDVEKAWRMMEIAKAKAIREEDQTLRHPVSRQITTKTKDSHTAKGQQYKIKKPDEPAKHKKEMGKQRLLELDKQLCRPVASKKNKASDEFFPTNSSSNGEFPLGKMVQTYGGDFHCENRRKPSNKIVDEVSSSSTMTQASDKHHPAREAGNDDDGKSEIRTLVKINLKLLSQGKNLGYERYKEVSRLATHAIMARCGLEPPPKPTKQYVSCSVCRHTEEEIRKLHRSTLMPDSCRKCFMGFVKDVVNAIMLEKLMVGSSS
ncbi:uncharacterized protein LOC103495032 [Cucumis melo]|uniref:Uncharacterized protein LOC103495032 n=1 Tax=Cucumis melo TaxID=3656 RepID=A0A1S3BYS2_CUCME|nr:uncharacterized protein LOC103495032 [Cucumis melo]